MSYMRKFETIPGTGSQTRSAFPGGIAEGSNLRTPIGLRRIEMIRPGDLIVTRDNGLQPVRCLWERRLTATQRLTNRDAALVCLSPRALGPMLPQARVHVDAGQRILVPGYRLAKHQGAKACLVAARDLVSGCDGVFVDTATAEIRLFTLVFDNHQIVCANGLPVESFLANASGALQLASGLRSQLLKLFPRLKRQPYAYPRVNYPVVDDARFLPDHA